MEREGERIDPGTITTDTRELTPGHWTSPERVNRLLTYDDGGKRFELEDVGPFINKERDVRLPDGWRPPAADAGSDRMRPSIDPVRPTRTVELTPGRNPATRETARREISRRPSIDPVRPTRTVELTPGRNPATRETARREISRRPSIDPVRPTRTVELTPGRTPTTRQTARPEVNQRPSIDPVRTTRTVELTPQGTKVTRPNAGERSKVPTQLTRPKSVGRASPVSSSAPKRANTAKAATPRSSPARNTSRTTSRARPSKAGKTKPD